ncbi:hypothetical protein R1flu_020194 [Riccia fluitans]|uniref:Uncharacterized protein n=1 Tax=Riccia fluitans TaxID=41844 RepID=A0ABD1ZKU2_9MARC
MTAAAGGSASLAPCVSGNSQIIGSPRMAPVTPVSGFPTMTFPTVPTPLPTIGGGGGGGSGGRGFGQTLCRYQGKTSPKPSMLPSQLTDSRGWCD